MQWIDELSKSQHLRRPQAYRSINNKKEKLVEFQYDWRMKGNILVLDKNPQSE